MRTDRSICQVEILDTYKKETDWIRLTGEKIYGMVKSSIEDELMGKEANQRDSSKDC